MEQQPGAANVYVSTETTDGPRLVAGAAYAHVAPASKGRIRPARRRTR